MSILSYRSQEPWKCNHVGEWCQRPNLCAMPSHDTLNQESDSSRNSQSYLPYPSDRRSRGNKPTSPRHRFSSPPWSLVIGGTATQGGDHPTPLSSPTRSSTPFDYRDSSNRCSRTKISGGEYRDARALGRWRDGSRTRCLDRSDVAQEELASNPGLP